jgi:hypothetical protein
MATHGRPNMGLKNFISRVTGVDQIKQELFAELQSVKQQLDEAETLRIEAEAEAEAAMIEAEDAKKAAEVQIKQAEEKAKIAQMTPKEQATIRGEPWISVLDTKFNPENPRNGFFEMDWNKPFIDSLISHGYGFDNDPEEEIVDRWFRELAYNILQESDIHTENRTAGYINIQKLTEQHSEIK